MSLSDPISWKLSLLISPLGCFSFSSGVPMTADASLDFRLMTGDRLGVLAALAGLSRFEVSNSLRGDVRL